MTLHAAKGLEFDIVFLPGWEEGLFPHQRALDERRPRRPRGGAPARLCRHHPGAARSVKIYFAANRRVRGLWQSSLPSRFIDELPEDHVEVVEGRGAPAYPASRFERDGAFASRYETPGWRRAQESAARQGSRARARRRASSRARSLARSTATAAFAKGDRVFHVKFGPGSVALVDGAKLTVDFDRAGRKMVMDSFVSAAG